MTFSCHFKTNNKYGAAATRYVENQGWNLIYHPRIELLKVWQDH